MFCPEAKALNRSQVISEAMSKIMKYVAQHARNILESEYELEEEESKLQTEETESEQQE